MKARIRFTRPIELDGENAIITITDMKKHKVEIVIPMKSLMHALMGVSGVDCEMDIFNISMVRTEFDRIKDMDIDEFAEWLQEFSLEYVLTEDTIKHQLSQEVE